MSQRTQAVLAASVLALSTASPAVALAQEPDQQQEGVASPEQPTEPAFDPGAGSTQLPLATTDDTVATEPEPAADVVAPTIDAGDGSGAQPPAPVIEQPKSPGAPAAPDAGHTDRPTTSPAKPVDERRPDRPTSAPDAGNPPTQPVVPTPTSEADDEPKEERPRPGRPAPNQATGDAPDGGQGQPSPPAGEGPADEPREPVQPTGTAPDDEPKSGTERAPVETLPVTTPGPPPDPTSAPQPDREAAPAPPAPQPPPTVAAPSPSASNASAANETSPAFQRARRGDRVHVVRPSESLWSIAAALLPADASAARIAREVNRLWELNSSRIATGDPDLLAIGTKLVLR